MGGAISAMHWSETFKNYSTSLIKVLADAAIHLNEQNHKTNRSVLQNRMLMFNKLFMNDNGGINQKCNDAYKDQPWKCFFAMYLHDYITLPVFYTQSLYDGWSH